MSSILAIDPELLLIGLAMPLGVALIVGLWRKRNGNGRRAQHAEEAIDPEGERAGEMSVAFWERRFVSIDKKLDEIIEELARMTGAN